MRRNVRPNGVIAYSGWKVNLTSEWAGMTVEVVESGGKVRVVYGDEVIAIFSTEEPKGFIGTGRRRGGVRLPRRVEGS